MVNQTEELEIQIKTIINQLGYIMYDLELKKADNQNKFIIYVQRDDFSSVDLDDCVLINKEILIKFDQENILKDEYTLEVSSAGIIRKLRLPKHFEQEIGNVIEVKTSKIVEGFEDKLIIGELQEYNSDGIKIDNIIIEHENIKEAKTTFNFEKGNK